MDLSHGRDLLQASWPIILQLTLNHTQPPPTWDLGTWHSSDITPQLGDSAICWPSVTVLEHSPVSWLQVFAHVSRAMSLRYDVRRLKRLDTTELNCTWWEREAPWLPFAVDAAADTASRCWSVAAESSYAETTTQLRLDPWLCRSKEFYHDPEWIRAGVYPKILNIDLCLRICRSRALRERVGFTWECGWGLLKGEACSSVFTIAVHTILVSSSVIIFRIFLRHFNENTEWFPKGT